MQQAGQKSALSGQGPGQQLASNTSQQASLQLPLQQSAEKCIRVGCNKPAVASEEWQQEYCSQECVVLHCNDIFSAWVASNQQKTSDILHSVKT